MTTLFAGKGAPMTETPVPLPQREPWYAPRSVWRSLVLRPRVYAGALAGIAVHLVLRNTFPAGTRDALAWCVGGAVYLALSYRVMARCNAEKIRTRAAWQDDSGIVILGLILLAIFSSFAAIFGLLGEAKTAPGDVKFLDAMLAAATIIIAWTVMQAAFTLHYAHEHYAPRTVLEPVNGGLSFPNDSHPDYWDFFYFATSIGATSQTSDVAVNSKAIRRLVTLHAMVSFFFNTMVLALTINLAASMA